MLTFFGIARIRQNPHPNCDPSQWLVVKQFTLFIIVKSGLFLFYFHQMIWKTNRQCYLPGRQILTADVPLVR